MTQVTTKILVNFKTQNIIHCSEHRGSNDYAHLLDQGYKEVGAIKTKDEPKIYWHALYFEPSAKYSSKPGK